MMKRWIWLLLALVASVAQAEHTYTGTMNSEKSRPYEFLHHEITMDATTNQTRAFDLGTSCSVKFIDGAGGDVVLYECDTSSTAYTSCETETTFTATTTIPYTFKPGKPWGRLRTAGTATGAVAIIDCAGVLAGGGGGLREDCADGEFPEWDEPTNEWICAAVAPGAGIANVVEDTSPSLGGDLDMVTHQLLNLSGTQTIPGTAAIQIDSNANGGGTTDYLEITDSAGNRMVQVLESGKINIGNGSAGGSGGAAGTLEETMLLVQGNLEVDGGTAALGNFGTDHDGSVLLWANFGGDAYVQIKPNDAAATTSWSWELPTSDGSNTNVMKTDGTGVTQWGAVGVSELADDLLCNANEVIARDGTDSAWDCVAAGGDILEIGNSSVGAVCASGTCFEGAGTEDNLAVTGDFKIRLDYDTNGANSFTVQNGGGANIMSVGETSAPAVSAGFAAFNSVTFATMTGTTSAAIPTITGGTAINVGTPATSTGTLYLWNYGGGNSGYTTIQAAASGSVALTLPADDGDSGEQLTTNGSGVLTWEAPGSGTSYFEVVDLATDLIQPTDDAYDVGFGYDGTGSAATDWAFHFDESAGILTMNVPDGYIDIAAPSTTGGALSLKEGADDGTNTWTLKAPDGGLSSTHVGTLTATGEIPADTGGTGIDSSSSTGVAVVSTGTWAIDSTPDLGTPSALVLTNATGSPTLTAPNIGAATGTSLDLGTGTIRGGVCTEYATAATISSGFAAGDMEGCWYFITSGTTTITLPAITADGQSACFYAVGANVITLDPNASDQIRRSDGTLQTAGVTITSPATAGSFGCFISANSSGTDDEWILLGANGTWAVGS